MFFEREMPLRGVKYRLAAVMELVRSLSHVPKEHFTAEQFHGEFQAKRETCCLLLLCYRPASWFSSPRRHPEPIRMAKDLF